MNNHSEHRLTHKENVNKFQKVVVLTTLSDKIKNNFKILKTLKKLKMTIHKSSKKYYMKKFLNSSLKTQKILKLK